MILWIKCFQKLLELLFSYCMKGSISIIRQKVTESVRYFHILDEWSYFFNFLILLIIVACFSSFIWPLLSHLLSHFFLHAAIDNQYNAKGGVHKCVLSSYLHYSLLQPLFYCTASKLHTSLSFFTFPFLSTSSTKYFNADEVVFGFGIRLWLCLILE